MRGHVFRQSYAMAAESREVPLEIFSNPTILSDDNLFPRSSDFSTPPLEKRGDRDALPLLKGGFGKDNRGYLQVNRFDFRW